jgi:hypothetical protein
MAMDPRSQAPKHYLNVTGPLPLLQIVPFTEATAGFTTTSGVTSMTGTLSYWTSGFNNWVEVSGVITSAANSGYYEIDLSAIAQSGFVYSPIVAADWVRLTTGAAVAKPAGNYQEAITYLTILSGTVLKVFFATNAVVGARDYSYSTNFTWISDTDQH